MTMADTTVERVRAIAGHLRNLPDSTIEIYIEDAKEEVGRFSLPADREEKLQRYLAAHLGTLQNPRPTDQKVKDLSLSYNRASGTGLDATEYGQEYKRLLRQASGMLRVM
jgi:acylphosphatase